MQRTAEELVVPVAVRGAPGVCRQRFYLPTENWQSKKLRRSLSILLPVLENEMSLASPWWSHRCRELIKWKKIWARRASPGPRSPATSCVLHLHNIARSILNYVFLSLIAPWKAARAALIPRNHLISSLNSLIVNLQNNHLFLSQHCPSESSCWTSLLCLLTVIIFPLGPSLFWHAE